MPHHKPSWSDCFPLQIYWTWIVAALIAGGLVLATQCSPREAHASQWSLDLGAGASFFTRTIEDSTWIQKGLPHSTDLKDFAYRAGVSYAFNDKYSIQMNYVNMGAARMSNTYVVEDHEYDAKSSTCLVGAKCLERGPFQTKDTMQGGEVSVTRTWDTGTFKPFARMGAALMMHHVHVVAGQTREFVLDMHGRVPMLLLGGGVQYQLHPKAALYWDATYYHGPGGMNCLTPCGLPVSKEMLLSIVGVRIPLS